ncbi:MAG: hypothetical protein COV45_00260 [Deltaproteobacteria bacterium CG11_big_fil_rev_8_21_14_0_20_47_16]|nr:MAG: hypothetical protein COV45_00260 [Deltaproteobacteria bacterium CG11_big_fil_rev_8_21_14_0_20_47_16]
MGLSIFKYYRTWFVLGLLAFIGIYLLYPQLELILFSLHTDDAFPTLHNYFEFFNPTRTYNQALWHSLWLSGTAVVTTTCLGLPLAFILTRFQFTGRTFFSTLATLPMIMPPFLGAYAFHLLLGKSGVITRIVMQLFNLHAAPWSIEGAQGIILVQMINFFPYIFLSVRGAFANIDPSLEEAARDLGARKRLVMRTITLPMLLPGITAGALLVFMNSMADFGTPYVMAPNYPVLSTFILQQKVLGDYPLAMTAAVILMSFSLLYFFLNRFYVSRKHFGNSGKGVAARPQPMDKPWQRWMCTIICTITFILIFLPTSMLVMSSLTTTDQWTTTIFPTGWTIDNYVHILAHAYDPIVNSFLLAGAATIGNILFGIVVAYLMHRTSKGARGLLDLTTTLPYALPGTVLGMSLLITFTQPHWFTGGHIVAGSALILILSYFTRHTPFVIQSVNANLQQMDRHTEEASQDLGASWWYTFQNVVFPLIVPGIVTGAIMSFVTSIGELSSTILLYPPSWPTISIAIVGFINDFDIGRAAALGVVQLAVVAMLIFGVNRLFGNAVNQAMD